MEINEAEARKLKATEEELEVPEGEDPLKYMEQLFGEPTPHDEMHGDDVNDEVYIVRFK